MKKAMSPVIPAAAPMATLAVVLFLIATAAQAQNIGNGPRWAVVIGNGSYAELGKLKNPANEAADMAASLVELGFKVEVYFDASLSRMEEAVARLGANLAQSADSIGFFFYAGHGAQSGGANYLIPADARIVSESLLKTKALSAQTVLDALQGARNALNVVVLDACRDNPFWWSRSGMRGLSEVRTQPPGSIVAYATSVGSVVQDGTGRNGVFTAELLKQLMVPGIEISEVFKRTGAAVQAATSGRQVPAVYNRFFGNAYLAGAASKISSMTVTSAAKDYGTITVTAKSAGTLFIDGVELGSLGVDYSARLDGMEAGTRDVEIRYADGKRESIRVNVLPKGNCDAAFTYVPMIVSAPAPERGPEKSIRSEIFVQGGVFLMGSDDEDDDAKPVHEVRVSSFWIMATEVTQKDFAALMWGNPSSFKGDTLPVEDVSWYDAVTYANELSVKDGLRPAYTINGERVRCEWWANGWRLPTEAEWEYAAQGGEKSRSYTYSGSNDADAAAWYTVTTDDEGTKPVGTKAANELGLYDMSGNVSEWCWDRYGAYSAGTQSDPRGAASGTGRVIRGGSWRDVAAYVRIATRHSMTPRLQHYYIGFRLVRPAVQ
jgi:formylglycine-generating enzyme required for sulfatase activity